ncbi:cysteine hydrolase family protein [Geodermatophilus sp. SYSU D00079]
MAPVAFRTAPETTALVVVDVQNDFCDPAGACGAAGADTTDAMAIVPPLERLLQAARAAGVLVVFVQTTHDETTDSPAWLSRSTVDASAPPRPALSTCRTGSWGAEFYGVAPAAGEPVVVKHRYSAFTGTGLDLVLRTAGIRSLLLTGVTTEVCVESTLRDGLFHDYHVTLVEDCCASHNRGAHAACVARVGTYFGAVTDSTELAAAWESARESA